MFYSEQLLGRTGPLAKVWLASNIEKKLTKHQILQQDLTTHVSTILNTEQAPTALRLNGQLMLGVVKIYGAKAKYLLHDCNETLVKIRMTFRSTNDHDLPIQATTSLDLNLTEQLTIDDLFPALDFGYPMIQQVAIPADDRAVGYDDEWASSLDPHTQEEIAGVGAEVPPIHDDDLGLDLGEHGVLEDTTISMQIGRGEATPRPDDHTDLPVYDDHDDLGLDLGEDVAIPVTTTRLQVEPMLGIEDDRPTIGLGEEEPLQEGRVGRDESPLSEPDPDFMADAARTFAQMQEEEEVEEEQVAAPQRQRRFKPMEPDREVVLHNSEIKAWGIDRSKLLKPQSLLPSDPELLALMEMQRSGNFVTNAINDGFGTGWAPEIQGLLTFDIVVRSGQKRKRDSGIADVVSEDGHSDKSPRLDVGDQEVEEEAMIEDEGVEVRELSRSPLRPRSEIPETHEPVEPPQPGLGHVIPGEDEEGIFAAEEGGFDDTTMPLVHPADSGPISVSTQHAVHQLREVFGGSPSAESPSSQSRRSVLLQDLIPETRTSREDATKMFFEILVLATKDAIKVDQDSKEIGLPIRVRAKRGLWGQWAEPSQTEPPTQEVGVTA